MEAQVSEIARFLLAERIRKGETITAAVVKIDVERACWIPQEAISDEGRELIIRTLSAMYDGGAR